MFSRHLYQFLVASTAIGCLIVITGCPNSDEDSYEPIHSWMIHSDLDALPTPSSREFMVNRVVHKFDAFSEIFGDYSADAVRKYVNQRAKIFVSMETGKADGEQVDISPSPHTLDPLPSPSPRQNEEPVGMAAAANIGTSLYLTGKFNRTQMSIIRGSKGKEAVTSPRIGLLIMPDDYFNSMQTCLGKTKDDKKDPARIEAYDAMARLLRQSTLVHESRHSDCAKEPTEEDVRQARACRNMDELEVLPVMRCGQTHGICTSGDLKGEYACDFSPWGSYSFEWVYQKGIYPTLKFASPERLLMDAMITSSKERLMNFDADAMLEGKLGKPDLSSFDDPVPTTGARGGK